MLDSLRSAPRAIRLGPFEVDFRSGELRRGGVTTTLQEQPRRILAMLAARAGDVVTREELRQAVWSSDTFVDFEHGLNAAVKRLRDTLGDSAETPAFIETLPRRGYRLIAPVEPLGLREAEPVSVTSKGNRTSAVVWMLAACGAIIAVAGLAGRFRHPSAGLSASAPHVVALPCRLIAGAEEERAYCDGLAALLTSRLASLTTTQRLQVTPSSEVRARNVTSAARARGELGAGLAFEGSVMRSGQTRAINYALVDTLTGSQVDATTFTAGVGDGFTSQERVVSWAIDALSRWLAEKPDVPQQRATQLAEAEDYAIQGRGYLLEHHRPGNVDTAITLFQRALALDPSHAPALAGLGLAFWRKFEATRDPAWVGRARDTCTQAQAANRALAEAQVCLGTVYAGTGEYERAADVFRRALQLEPESDAAHRGLAAALEQLGRYEEAEQTFLRAIELRPHYWEGRIWLGSFYRTRARFDESIAQYREATQLSPDNARAFAVLGGALTLAGRYPEAVEACRRSVQLVPNPYAYNNWGMAVYRQRRFTEAVNQLEMAHALLPHFRVLGNLARAAYWAGDRERARRLYEEALTVARQELSLNPRHSDAQLQVAEFLVKLGRPREAVAILDGTRLASSHDRHFAAMTLAQAGESARALTLLREAIDTGLPRVELAAWIDLDPLRTNPKFPALQQP
jgi:tetratricopeptide (TPR) repeat protein/DNA-binding winged helix-turn-helix (wHTH) protein/TolB-like protein